ncbi:hypothetical protein JAAARDRAFT_41939 [Jaapia argillacea MUCL 33604]|uniref:F-box domain-containing protein n=1 Tax=Jaapia argillacea MUCL 33604 TaxID=933084 RepID=A0A067PJ58_9AGAM|nr:hypothetical protein JAAARDRAFT_41939 [Jaapia argillacea MUCL 33604]
MSSITRFVSKPRPDVLAEQLVELPPELWRIVVEHLPFRDVLNFSMTCRALRNVARPALFETLAVTVVVGSKVDEMRRDPGGKIAHPLASSPEKLEFYASEHLAFAVKTCMVVLRSPYPLREGDMKLIRQLFEALPAFTNLTRLSLTCVELDPSIISRIRQLSNLQNLTLDRCQLSSSGGDPFSPRVRPLSIPFLSILGRSHELFDAMRESQWALLDLLDPTRLRTLSVTMGRTIIASSFFSWTVPPICFFPNLTKLQISYACISSPLIPHVLEKFPALEELHLSGVRQKYPLFPSPVFVLPASVPRLHTYIGPDFCITAFAQCCIKKIVTTCGETTEHSDATNLVSLFTQLSHPEAVVSLEFSTYHLTEALVSCIADLFGSTLKKITMRIWTADVEGFPDELFSHQKIMESLPPRLPSPLVDLEIRTQFAYLEDLNLDTLDVFVLALRERCRGIQRIAMAYKNDADGNEKTWRWSDGNAIRR